MFVMRPSNDRDQALIRSAISDAGASMLTFVPSLGTGEVFAFGAGVPLPTRMKFCELPAALRPTREAGGNTRVAAGALPDRNMIDSVIDRWHASTMSKGQIDDGGELMARGHRASARGNPEISGRAADAAGHATRTGICPCPRRAGRARNRAAAAAEAEHPARPLSSEPLGPNNPAPLPSRYR